MPSRSKKIGKTITASDWKTSVLKNDAITKITTPYFEGYELDIWGKMGQLDEIEKMLDSEMTILGIPGQGIEENFEPEIEHVGYDDEQCARNK